MSMPLLPLQALSTETLPLQAFSLLRRHSSMNMQRMKRTFLAEIRGHNAHQVAAQLRRHFLGNLHCTICTLRRSLHLHSGLTDL